MGNNCSPLTSNPDCGNNPDCGTERGNPECGANANANNKLKDHGAWHGVMRTTKGSGEASASDSNPRSARASRGRALPTGPLTATTRRTQASLDTQTVSAWQPDAQLIRAFLQKHAISTSTNTNTNTNTKLTRNEGSQHPVFDALQRMTDQLQRARIYSPELDHMHHTMHHDTHHSMHQMRPGSRAHANQSQGGSRQVLASHPLTYSIESFIPTRMCQHFLRVAEEVGWGTAMTVGGAESVGGANPIRRSSAVALPHTQTPVTYHVARCIAEHVGLPLHFAEIIQVWYGMGAEWVVRCCDECALACADMRDPRHSRVRSPNRPADHTSAPTNVGTYHVFIGDPLQALRVLQGPLRCF